MMRHRVNGATALVVALSGATAVAFGAFGAHALRGLIDGQGMQTWHTGVEYHFWHTLALFATRGLTPHIRHRVTSYEAGRTLVGRGLGYGILVQRVANPASYEGYPVVTKEISPTVEPVGIDVIWSATHEPPERVTALIAFARTIDWGAVGR